MQAMAHLALRRGKNENAETLRRDVLARRLEQPHPDPMLIASPQNDLGVALERLGKHDETETLHRPRLAKARPQPGAPPEGRSAEHPAEPQSLMRNSYAVSSLKNQKTTTTQPPPTLTHTHIT